MKPLTSQICKGCGHYFGTCDLDCNCLCDKFAWEIIEQQTKVTEGSLHD